MWLYVDAGEMCFQNQNGKVAAVSRSLETLNVDANWHGLGIRGLLLSPRRHRVFEKATLQLEIWSYPPQSSADIPNKSSKIGGILEKSFMRGVPEQARKFLQQVPQILLIVTTKDRNTVELSTEESAH